MIRRIIFALLFLSFGTPAWAAPLQFASDPSNYGKTLVEGHPLGKAVARWVKETGTAMTYLSAQVDLNQDGQPEFFVMLRHPKTCDQYGCLVVGFMYDKGIMADNAKRQNEQQAKVAEARKNGFTVPYMPPPKSPWNVVFNNKGKTLEVLGRNAKTGMVDLLVDGSEPWVWDGQRYNVRVGK
jgi:hypothetical protein